MAALSISKMKEWYFRYERRLSGAALIAGFVVDSVTLKRIDLLFENVILVTHLSLVGSSIVILNLYEGGVVRGGVFGAARRITPFIMQFSFGALFSAFFIFYSRSASLAASWPFLLFLLALLVGNEFLRGRYERLVFQVSIFYIALFSFLILYVPIVFGAINAWVFLASGASSLILITGILYLMGRVLRARFAQARRALTASIGSIFIVVTILYFLNVIPPIPLSLKEAGVYHAVLRTDEGYLARTEAQSWYEFLRPYDVLHLTPSAPAYAYSAVFAPARLKTEIVHEWQYFDAGGRGWVTASRVQFPIIGGRDGGYRGYSLKRVVFPGRWRVNVETRRGQLFGRIHFRIENVSVVPLLETQTL